jgi:hypothetical protein
MTESFLFEFSSCLGLSFHFGTVLALWGFLKVQFAAADRVAIYQTQRHDGDTRTIAIFIFDYLFQVTV